MGKNVVLRYLLEQGHTLDVVMPAGKAREEVKLWQAGSSFSGWMGGYDEHRGRYWALDRKRVQRVLTMQLEQPQPAAPGSQRQPAALGCPGSGGNLYWEGAVAARGVGYRYQAGTGQGGG